MADKGGIGKVDQTTPAERMSRITRNLPPVVARRGPPGLDNRVLFGTGMAGILASLAALSLAAAVDQWGLGLLLAGVALLISSIAIGVQLANRSATPSVVDKSLLIAAMDSDSLGRAITDRDGHMVSANHTYRHLCFGRVPAPRDLGLDIAESRQAMKEISASLADTGKGWGILEIRSRGRSRKLEVSCRTYGLYILWAVKQADPDMLLQQAISDARQNLCPLMDALSLGVVVRNNAGQIRYLSKVACDLLGLDEARARSLNWSDIADEGGSLVNPDSEELLDVEALDSRVPGLNEKYPIGWLTLLRKRLAAPVRSTADGPAVSTIFAEAPFAVVILNAKAELRDFNRAFQDLFGEIAGREIAEGEDFAALVPKAERDEFVINLKKAVGGNPPQLPMELRYGKDDDTIVQVYFSAAGAGQKRRAILYLIDTTEQRSLEIQFVQAQKMQAVGQLAGGIAHDFNNLLTAIIGFCDLLLMRHGPGDQSFSDLMQVKQNASRAANLIRQLLAFSRRQTLRPTVLVVTDVLAEISNLIRRLIGENITFEVSHGRDLGAVKADQGQFEQVIINLVVNARDAMEGGGKLTVTTRNVGPKESGELGYKVMPAGDYVLISVADTGPGIPEENIAKLFEPFFTTKEVGKGTGLGLSTVYGIVKQSGGFIFARSEPGEGATFDIYLPVYTPEEADKAASAAEEAGEETPVRDLTGNETILIVEDEDAVRLFASRALANKGYTVLEAISGEAALELIDAHDGEIDLLLSDVVMPGMDGPSLVEKVLEMRPGMKVILISGYAEEEFRKKLHEGDFSFLPKPFSLQELAERVKAVLEEA